MKNVTLKFFLQRFNIQLGHFFLETDAGPRKKEEEEKKQKQNPPLLSLFDTYSNIFVFLYPRRFSAGQSEHLEEGVKKSAVLPVAQRNEPWQTGVGEWAFYRSGHPFSPLTLLLSGHHGWA